MENGLPLSGAKINTFLSTTMNVEMRFKNFGYADKLLRSGTSQ